MSVFSDFFSYRGGVYDRVSDDYVGGHGIAVFGWDDIEQCWICKNSWGADWGEEGWFRIAYSYTVYPDFKSISDSFYVAVYCSGAELYSDIGEITII